MDNKEIEPNSPTVDSEEEGLSKEEYEKILKIPSRKAQKAKAKKQKEIMAEEPKEAPLKKEEPKEEKPKEEEKPKVEEKPKKRRGRPKKAPEEKKPRAPHPFKKMREMNKDYESMRNELNDLRQKLQQTKKEPVKNMTPEQKEDRQDEIKALKMEIENLKKAQVPKKKSPFDKLGDIEKSLLDRLRG